jgi:hypothetical protein
MEDESAARADPPVSGRQRGATGRFKVNAKSSIRLLFLVIENSPVIFDFSGTPFS